MPKLESTVEVLIVGAGPVGMFTALLLAKKGISVAIIDQEWRTTVHSYACALHPATYRLLQAIGLGEEIAARGRRVETVGFYEGDIRHGEVRLAELPGQFSFIPILPQSALERLIEQRLQAEGVEILWNHRLCHLQQTRSGITAALKSESTKEDLSGDRSIDARFLIAADGRNSFVRRHLGIFDRQMGERESFVVYEFQLEEALENEARVVLDENSTSVLWPLFGTRARWTLQIPPQRGAGVFPAKERTYEFLEGEPVPESVRDRAEKLIAERAPWFNRRIREAQWYSRVDFEHRLAERFYVGRCALVGDAAHQISPVGMQSMNLGMQEGALLAEILPRALDEGSPAALLEKYNSCCQTEWSFLLGQSPPGNACEATTNWITEHYQRIVPCIPASGSDRELLLRQLGLPM